MKMITDWVLERRDRTQPRWLARHNIVGRAAAGVFIDTSVFFCLAINFASVVFNYTSRPALLYVDKLGQSSSLLSIDTPVALLLMSYHCIDRTNLRILLVSVIALMTFIIQFLFRRARSFDPDNNLCLAWSDHVEHRFVQRFQA